VSSRLSALHVPVPLERYVDARVLADALGISTRTVTTWVAQGCPSETWGMRVRRFRVSEVAAWAKSRETTRTMATPRGDDCDVPDLRQRQRPKE
jgi:phage terminase Nu1 subunit (DNA packaging protein)